MIGRICALLSALCVLTTYAIAAEPASTDGWTSVAPRDEIKPLFRYEPTSGRDGKPALVIAGDDRDGTTGWWQRKFAVEGGKTYRFIAWRKIDGVESARRSGLARVLWSDGKGRTVKRDEPTAGR
jgi:hypothetical protein